MVVPNADLLGKKVLYLEDRSGAETDDTCGMKYYLNRLHLDGGIVPEDEPINLLIGRESHEDLATIAQWEDLGEVHLKDAVAEIVSPLTEEDKKIRSRMELLYRRLGWLVAWTLYMEPTVRENYETIHIEHELIYEKGQLWVPVTPDRILKNRRNGMFVYSEFKSTISSSNKWMSSWQFMPQLHLGMAAVGDELKARVSYAQVIGLMKGFTSAADGRLAHPYVWGWWNQKTDDWTHDYQQARGHEWVSMPVWEYPAGVVEWVKRCGPEVAKKQFPCTPPITLNQRLLDEWVLRRTARQQQIACVKDACKTDEKLRSVYFERRTKNCRPAFGDECQYLRVCWNAEVARDPLAKGFVKRDPHHDVERTINMEDV